MFAARRWLSDAPGLEKCFAVPKTVLLLDTCCERCYIYARDDDLINATDCVSR